MRICSPQLGISPDSNLGGEVHDREILKALAGLGVEIDIILPFGKKHEKVEGWNIYYLPLPFVYPPWLFNFLILPYLFWIYHKKPFEILRVHSPYFVGPAALFFKFFNQKVKLVVVYHHLENNRVYRFIDKVLIKNYNLIITVSESTKNELAGIYQIDISKVKVVPNGVNTEKYKYRPKDKKLISKYNLTAKKVLLYLGQLIERKNIGFLFDVLFELSEDYILIICGDGDQREKLERKVKELNLGERVFFTGYIDEEEKVKYYNIADLFVFPSKQEGFGLSLLEAMACGKPVLAPDLSVFTAVMDNGVNGYLLETDCDKWVNKIIEIFKDKNMLKTVGKRAEGRAKSFSWKKSAEKYLESL